MKIIDLHEDIAYSAQKGIDVINEESAQSSIKLLKKFEDTLVFASIFPHVETINDKSFKLSKLYGRFTRGTAFSFYLLLDQLKFYNYLERKKYVKIIKTVEDLKSKDIKFLISLEGADVLRDSEDLYLLKDLNVLCLGLTWNYNNKFASSCMSKKDYGLTDEGEEIVRIANNLGIIIDLAHSSKNTILEVTSLSKKPVIVSHANVKRLKEHIRNINDEEIEAIVKTGGVIGITAIVETLKEPKIKAISENIRYIGESFGWEYVAIGTDFLGIERTPEGFENILKIKEIGKLFDEHKEVFWENPMRVILQNLT